MGYQVNDNGVWKDPKNISVNDNGVWKDVQKSYVNDNGVWKETYSREKPWIKIIDGVGTTISQMSNFGDTSQLTTTFSSDATYGITWGTTDNIYKTFIIDPNISFTEMYIQYSGNYSVPSGGLGWLQVRNDDATAHSLSFYDAHTNNSSGQYLYINNVAVFTASQTVVVDREDILTSSYRNVSMKGYTSAYPYTRRYIKNLWIR